MPRAKTIEEKVAERTAQINAEQQGTPQVRKTTDRASRRQRGVFNGTTGKLKISEEARNKLEEAGWHLHIFNDTPGRVEEALTAGYEFVTTEEIGSAVNTVVSRNTDLSDKVRFLVGVSEEGDGMYAYLMKIKKEYFEEDQEDLQKRNDRVDEAIKSARNVKPGTSSEGFYDGGIKYKT